MGGVAAAAGHGAHADDAVVAAAGTAAAALALAAMTEAAVVALTDGERTGG